MSPALPTPLNMDLHSDYGHNRQCSNALAEGQGFLEKKKKKERHCSFKDGRPRLSSTKSSLCNLCDQVVLFQELHFDPHLFCKCLLLSTVNPFFIIIIIIFILIIIAVYNVAVLRSSLLDDFSSLDA